MYSDVKNNKDTTIIFDQKISKMEELLKKITVHIFR